MAYFLCLKPWIAVFQSFSGHGVLWISTTTCLLILLSTLIFTSWKQKPGQLLVKEKSSSAEFVEVLESAEEKIEPINEEDDDKAIKEHEQYNLDRSTPQDLYSESDIASMDQDQYSTSSEDSEKNYYWSSYSAVQKPAADCSDDDSMSDEEGLIEIAIPSGQYLSPEKEMKKKKLTDHFSQEANCIPLEFLAEINEMNEEDNLIEIDIYMGSIKCSRFSI